MLYIIGPMTGYENFNLERFREAQRHFQRQGYDTFIPHDLDHQLGPLPPEGTVPYRAYLANSVRFLLFCDDVAALHGYEESNGAAAEYALARALGLGIWHEDEYGNWH